MGHERHWCNSKLSHHGNQSLAVSCLVYPLPIVCGPERRVLYYVANDYSIHISVLIGTEAGIDLSMFVTSRHLQNVVVVNQPTASSPLVQHVTVVPRASTYMVLTMVLMVLCLLQCNLAALLCLIPALIFAMMVSRAWTVLFTRTE